MSNCPASHRPTRFDAACEEIQEYDKTYNSSLSYGYYSAYKETGKLPKEWYEHLIEVQKDFPKNFDESAAEYQEYKRRFHKRLSHKKYIRDRDNGKLQRKWYLYLIESTKRIPNDFRIANAEYFEYLQAFNDNISIYEYYEKKDKGDLPEEWYQFLDQLKRSIADLLQTAVF